MPVNSISPSQPAQASQVSKVAETAAARKESDIKQANKVLDRNDTAERQAQLKKTQEASKPVVNTNGQQTGTRINVSA